MDQRDIRGGQSLVNYCAFNGLASGLASIRPSPARYWPAPNRRATPSLPSRTVCATSRRLLPDRGLSIARIVMNAPIGIRPAPRSPRICAAVAAAAALLLLLPAASARAQSDPLIAKVDGVEIYQSDLSMAEEDIGQNAQQMPPDAKRDYLVGYLSDVILASKAAEGKKIADQKEFKSRIEFIRRKLLMEMLL